MVALGKSWESKVLVAAAAYNILWGSWVILFPNISFTVFGMEAPRYIEIWQCVGMIVGVYGLGYFIAASSPRKHWPIVLVGLLGKLLGPIGFIDALVRGVFPISFGINIIFNDLIWWAPFSIILYNTFRSYNPGKEVKIGQKEIETFSPRKKTQFINSLSGFKSLNLIGTINSKGQPNLSIISSTFHLGSDPSLLGFIIRPDVSPRHTLDNIRENMSCTLNHVNSKIFKKAHQTSARYDRDESEFEMCGLTEVYKDKFLSPFVKESFISLSLEIQREIKIEENGTHLVIGKISNVYLPENCVSDDGHINLEKAKTICLSGLDSYHSTDFIDRLAYAKPLKKTESL